MKTVQDLHVDFRQTYQSLSANNSRNFYPEEIDSLYAKAQEVFLQTKIESLNSIKKLEFLETQALLDDVRDVITTRYLQAELLGYINTTQGNFSQYRVTLPPAYLFNLSTGVHLTKCKEEEPVVKTLYYQTFGFTGAFDQVGSNFKTFELRLTQSGTIQDINQATVSRFWPVGTGFKSKNYYLWLKHFLHTVNRPDVARNRYTVYWERYKDLFVPNRFILVTDLQDLSVTSFTVEGAVQTVDARVSRVEKVNEGTGTRVKGRLVRNNTIDYCLNSKYEKPSANSPIVVMGNEGYQLFVPENVLVVGITTTYLKEPQPISLDLRIQPEFKSTTALNKISQLAVELAMVRTQDERTQFVVEQGVVKAQN